jgi:dTDP-glucose 4,6-dehydratase
VRLLVTGGAGFIGSNYVRLVLATTDHEVVVLDVLTYAGGRDTVATYEDDPRVTFVHGDICDRDAALKAMDGCDVVVHFAAESHVDRSVGRSGLLAPDEVGPDAFVRTNCLGTNVLCDIARQIGVERFVHVSTDEVYGSRADGSFSEDDLLAPSSPYSASKAGSDLIALGYQTSFGLPVVVTRAANNYGPFQFPEKIIPLFVTNLFDGLPVGVYGDGGNIRDWLYVDDHCRAVELVREHGQPGQVYNVGGSAELTNLELTRRLVELVGADERLITFVEDRPGHDFRYSITLERIRDLGYEPSLTIDEGLERTVAWYRDNEWWWRPRKVAPSAGT